MGDGSRQGASAQVLFAYRTGRAPAAGDENGIREDGGRVEGNPKTNPGREVMGMEAAVESYLARLDKALGPIAVSERASIVTEIKSHILEARDRSPKSNINSILDSLGE